MLSSLVLILSTLADVTKALSQLSVSNVVLPIRCSVEMCTGYVLQARIDASNVRVVIRNRSTL